MSLQRILALGAVMLLLNGCGKTGPMTPVPSTQASLPPETTEAAPVPPPTETTLPAETLPPEPVHSELYIPEVSTEDVIRYFVEVCLGAEYIHSGDPSLLQKWEEPIAYILHGDPTAEDLDTLSGFTAWLNTIEGFPGISRTEDAAAANLRIHFCSQEMLLELMGQQFTGLDGAVTFWYQEDAIYDAIICCRTDLDQHLRNSVILEEVYNCLGPIQDTYLRPDSIIAQEFSTTQSLTKVDELILKLLYHPRMTCGMDSSQCEAVIRELYY